MAALVPRAPHRDSTADTVTPSPAREVLPCGVRTRLSVTLQEDAASMDTRQPVLAATGLLGAQDNQMKIY